jgi:hypothetical protein
VTAPNSKAKRSPAERLKRKIAKKFRARRERFPHEDAALAPPRVRLAGAEIESFQVACADVMHPIHFVREGDTLKAIVTPCGIASSRAAWNLGADTCYKVIALAQGMVGDKPVMPPSELPADRTGITDMTGVVLRAVGDSAALAHHKALRRDRLKRRHGLITNAGLTSALTRGARAGKQGIGWDRTTLTRAALPKLIAQAAGEGAKVWLEGRRAYVQLAGQEVPSCCVFDTDSWACGPGPQAPDAVYRALKRWTKLIQQFAGDARAPLRTPGFQPV